MYVIKVNFVVNDSVREDTDISLKLESLIEDALIGIGIDAEHISSEFIDMDQNDNCGMCAECGNWTSDYGKENCIQELSNGAIVDGKWLCDLCLPKDHPNHF